MDYSEPHAIYPSTNLRLLSGLFIACDIGGYITRRKEVTPACYYGVPRRPSSQQPAIQYHSSQGPAGTSAPRGGTSDSQESASQRWSQSRGGPQYGYFSRPFSGPTATADTNTNTDHWYHQQTPPCRPGEVVDAQGLQFTHSLTSISRERYQQLRQRHYDNYRNTDHSLAEVQNQLTPVKTGGQFYRFRYSSLRPTEQSYIAHFQLRNLVRATGADEIFYVHQSGLRRWSPSSRKSHAVVDIRDEQSVLTTSTLATNSEMAFLG
ncbi:hypothetical protein H4R33_003417, partial [Dimargaris cristalligena]